MVAVGGEGAAAALPLSGGGQLEELLRGLGRERTVSQPGHSPAGPPSRPHSGPAAVSAAAGIQSPGRGFRPGRPALLGTLRPMSGPLWQQPAPSEGSWAAQGGWPALSMEYGGPVVAMARALHHTVRRELGSRRAAGLAMEEKAAPPTMQTVELVTPAQMEPQVVWQNPYLRSGPSEMTHHQKGSKPPAGAAARPQARISEAEIRRTADRVFRLVQEKIAAERRRTGRL